MGEQIVYLFPFYSSNMHWISLTIVDTPQIFLVAKLQHQREA